MNKKLSALLGVLCFTSGIYAQIINDFEQGTASLTANSAVYKNQSGTAFSIMQCNVSPGVGSVFTPFTAINNYTNKNSLMTAVNDPILASSGLQIPAVGQNGGNYSLRLNNSSAGSDITSYTQTFMPTSKYISFDYLAVSKSPHTDPDEEDVQPFFTARLLDANDNIIQSLPLCIKAIFGDPILSNNNNDLFYTKGFYCQSLIIPERYINKENIKIQFVVADCGWGGDTGMVYLDNIRLGDPCEHQQSGTLWLNPLETECSPKRVDVTGKYKEPNGTIYVDSTLTVLDSAGNPVAIPNGDIILNNFSGGSFSYTVVFNPPLPEGAYEIKVTAHFKTPSGVLYSIEDISTNEGADVSFQDPSPLNVTIVHDDIMGILTPYGSASWDDVGGPYTIEFISDGYCCVDKAAIQNIDGVVHTIITNDNSIDNIWDYMAGTLSSKCLRFRVRTECKEWSSWCCTTSYDKGVHHNVTDPNDYFNVCLDEIDFDKLDPNAFNLTAYPNPTTGFVSVANSNATVFDIYDLNQQKVKSVKVGKTQEKVDIDLSDLKKGIYILKTDKNQEVKFIKQ